METTASRRTIQDLTSLLRGGGGFGFEGYKAGDLYSKGGHFLAGSIHEKRSQSVLRVRDGSPGVEQFQRIGKTRAISSPQNSNRRK